MSDKKVLIVDDFKMMLCILHNLLKKIGINAVDEATDGADALKRLKERKYDLIISDDNMYPMTGFELLQEIRADHKLKDVPFIMVSGESRSESIVAAQQAGVSNYIVKPFNCKTLKSKIESILELA